MALNKFCGIGATSLPIGKFQVWILLLVGRTLKTFDAAVKFALLGVQNAPQTPMPLARHIALHWVVRLLITWFGFGLLTWASVAGLQAMSVEISPVVSLGMLAVCALVTVFAVTRLIEWRNNATVWSASAIALEAGVSIGAAYMATRSLWFAMGLHTAWNFLQGTVFGVAVSGVGAPTDSLFTSLMQGNPWLTGGAFGIEASVIAIVLGLGLGSYFMVQAVRQQRIMRGLLQRHQQA